MKRQPLTPNAFNQARAFYGGRRFTESNTSVKTDYEVYDYDKKIYRSFQSACFLHGNLIAARDYDGNVYYSCAGWHTRTTQSRLAALGAPARIRDSRIIDERTGRQFPSKLTRFD